MKINEFKINSTAEVTVKIAKEVLLLFKIEIMQAGEVGAAVDYDCISIENHVSEENGLCVATRLVLQEPSGACRVFTRDSVARPDERKAAATRRLIKRNIYDILLAALNGKSAPWGILHGVRPTKIVHHYINQGLTRAVIVDRLQEDYGVQANKAELLVNLAFKQRPFLALSNPRMVSVYIGIPFCLSRCLYCSFPSYVLPNRKVLQEFLAVLEKDILAAKAIINEKKLIVQNIYVGGGTPTSLPDKEFAAFLALVKGSFFQRETREFTVEAGRPDSVDDAKIAAMVAHSVNRVSVNPQTMQEKTLKHIGRNHTTSDIIELFDKFRQSGMPNINMDLIIGLPGETVAEVEDTMRQIVALAPDDITLHALALKKGSVLKTNREVYSLPDDEMTAQMFAAAMRAVENLQMEPYYLYRQGYMSGNLENIGYSRSGAEGLYNIQIMEEQQTIIGIGPAATTKVIDPVALTMETSFNAKDLTTYLHSVDKYIKRRSELLYAAFRN